MAGQENSEKPSDWPGNIWIEGKTVIHLKKEQERPSHMPRGPAKKTGEGFLNPAMAPARTRSVMLLADALENDWLIKRARALEFLTHYVLPELELGDGEMKFLIANKEE